MTRVTLFQRLLVSADALGDPDTAPAVFGEALDHMTAWLDRDGVEDEVRELYGHERGMQLFSMIIVRLGMLASEPDVLVRCHALDLLGKAVGAHAGFTYVETRLGRHRPMPPEHDPPVGITQEDIDALDSQLDRLTDQWAALFDDLERT